MCGEIASWLLALHDGDFFAEILRVGVPQTLEAGAFFFNLTKQWITKHLQETTKTET